MDGLVTPLNLIERIEAAVETARTNNDWSSVNSVITWCKNQAREMTMVTPGALGAVYRAGAATDTPEEIEPLFDFAASNPRLAEVVPVIEVEADEPSDVEQPADEIVKPKRRRRRRSGAAAKSSVASRIADEDAAIDI